MQEEKPGKLVDRTVDYGLAVIDFCEKLPRNPARDWKSLATAF